MTLTIILHCRVTSCDVLKSLHLALMINSLIILPLFKLRHFSVGPTVWRKGERGRGVVPPCGGRGVVPRCGGRGEGEGVLDTGILNSRGEKKNLRIKILPTWKEGYVDKHLHLFQTFHACHVQTTSRRILSKDTSIDQTWKISTLVHHFKITSCRTHF